MSKIKMMLILGFWVAFLCLLQGDEGSLDQGSAVNAVIGDLSYVRRFGNPPPDGVSEAVRIRTHLKYVEDFLRSRDMAHLTQDQRKSRNDLLRHLGVYSQAEQFPHNHAFTSRRPCFIDDEGRICAVGYLVEQSAGRDLAEQINKRFQYAYVWEMWDEEHSQWVADSGFTAEELAMIQPAYSPCLGRETYILLPNGQTPHLVDFEDFLAFAEAFGSREGELKWNPLADLDDNRAVDFNDFLGFASTFGRRVVLSAVSGRVLHDSAGLEGVAVQVTGSSFQDSVVTDSQGSYVITGLANGNYQFVPQSESFTFMPDTQEEYVACQDIEIPDFTAGPVSLPARGGSDTAAR